MFRKPYYLISLLSAILMTSSAKSQIVMGDFQLSAVLNAGNVNLSWQQPATFTVSYYLVYKAEVGAATVFQTGQTSWSTIDSTMDTEYVDTTAPSKDTAFVYLVKAFNSSGQSVLSNIAVVFVNPFDYHRDRVTITSNPPLDATVNSLYTYQVTAVSDSTDAILRYHLGEHPATMTIDTSTGLVSWTPLVRGYREVEVVVTSILGGRTSQEFMVRVAGLNGKVAGNVTDTLGNPLPHVIIHLYQTGMWPFIGMMAPIGFFDYYAETDSNGNYKITHIDQGKYLIRATPLNQNYLPAWYDSSITISDTSTHIVNFKLENRFHLLPKFTVSGTVTDTTGTPIKNAAVVFARAGFVFDEAKENQNEWSNDENFRDFFEDAIHDKEVNHEFDLDDLHSPYVFVTYTGNNGAYKDTLPEGHYVIFARAKGYYKIFYNNEVNLLTADILTLTSDTTNINFKLIPIPSILLGQIGGSVFDSTSGAGVAARMIAFRDIWSYKDTLKLQVPRFYFTDADTTGAYTFTDLPPGYYKILALPLGNYVPSFYSTNGPTVRWKEATAVQIDGNSVDGIDIYVMPIPDSVSGYASISGAVMVATQANHESVNSTTAVNGAIVYASDANGNIVGYGVTDGNGNYTITGVAQGTFNVFTDAIGYGATGSTSSSTTYNSDGSATSGTANLSVTPEAPTAVISTTGQPASYLLGQNYPNPFNPTTQIGFNIAQTEHVNVTVFNILGQKIATIVDGEISPGAHVVMWDGRNQHGEAMPSGIYFYRLSTPNFTAVKKMVLLK